MNPTHFCRHLRTKKMYIPALADQAFVGEDGETSHSPHCWCNRTLTETGPDDRAAAAHSCTKSRSCFEE